MGLSETPTPIACEPLDSPDDGHIRGQHNTRSQFHTIVADYWDMSANEAWFDFFVDEEAVMRIKADDVKWIKRLPDGPDSGPAPSID